MRLLSMLATLRFAASGRIGRSQRDTRLQAGHRFQETHDFIRTQHYGQLLSAHVHTGIRSGRSACFSVTPYRKRWAQTVWVAGYSQSQVQ